MTGSGQNEEISSRRSWVVSLAAMLAVVLLWIVLTEGGLVKPLYLPGPRELARALSDVASDLPRNILDTLARVIVGYSLGVVLGVGLGLLMGYSATAKAALHGIVEAWRPVPPVALVPFFLLWFGFSFVGRILLVSLGVSLIMVVATYEAMRNIPSQLIDAARTLGARKREILWTVQWPGIRPELRGPLRVSMALSIGLVIVSEFLGAQTGLGYLINVSKVTFSTHVILLVILILGILSGVLDFLLRKSLEVSMPWATALSQSSLFPPRAMSRDPRRSDRPGGASVQHLHSSGDAGPHGEGTAL